MHKKGRKPTLYYLFFLLFFTTMPINSMSLESIGSIGSSRASLVIAAGIIPLSYLLYQSFFGSSATLKDRENNHNDDKLLFQETDQPAQEKSESSSFFSVFYKGIMLGIGVLIAAGLWSVSQNSGVHVATDNASSPLMIGPAEDVDLTKYVKMPEDISENFDDLTSLPSSLKTILEDVRRGGEPPKGMLFFGEPGAGKSHSSKAFAKECRAVLFRIPGYEFTGQGADFSRRLFTLIDRVKKDYAQDETEKRIFLVIDEAEVFGIRSKLGFSTMQLDLSGTVRALMDYTEQKENGVTCILTTNHPELIDGALKRPGRVGEHVEFKNPDKDERYSILKLHAKQKNVLFTPKALKTIVAQSEGWTGDYLAQCVTRCKRSSINNKTIQSNKAKQIALEIGEQWAANQEKREKSCSSWRAFLKSGFASVGFMATGVPAPVFSTGVDAVGSLFEE